MKKEKPDSPREEGCFNNAMEEIGIYAYNSTYTGKTKIRYTVMINAVILPSSRTARRYAAHSFSLTLFLSLALPILTNYGYT